MQTLERLLNIVEASRDHTVLMQQFQRFKRKFQYIFYI